jgi:SAM-dependent methyltransferase
VSRPERPQSDSKQAVDSYIANRWSAGIEPYAATLRDSGLPEDASRILDVGCGPGQWTLAAASLAPGADVTGVDPNEQELRYASSAAVGAESRVHFRQGSCDDLPGYFGESSFDVVLCNGVLMYLDRPAAFQIFGYLLADSGHLFAFHNHHVGYYLQKTIAATRRRSLKQIYGYGVKGLIVNPLARSFRGRDQGDTFLTPRILTESADAAGVSLQVIPDGPQLTYRRTYLKAPVTFAVRGVRQSR